MATATRRTAAMLNLLTTKRVQHAGDGDHSDGGGLLLRVRGESCSWVLRYTAACDEHLTVVRRLSASRFVVEIGVAESEQQARRSRELAREGIGQKRRTRATELRETIPMMPKDAAAFRSGEANVLREVIRLRSDQAIRLKSAR